jgi:hypothetical protein
MSSRAICGAYRRCFVRRGGLTCGALGRYSKMHWLLFPAAGPRAVLFQEWSTQRDSQIEYSQNDSGEYTTL